MVRGVASIVVGRLFAFRMEMASQRTARRRRGAVASARATAPVDLLVYRYRLLVRRGRRRQAAQLARQLVFRDQTASAWVRLGAALARCSRVDASVDAFKQGWWIYRQHRCNRQAEVVSRLIDRVREGRFPCAA